MLQFYDTCIQLKFIETIMTTTIIISSSAIAMITSYMKQTWLCKYIYASKSFVPVKSLRM